ncbi:hypothetical protein U9M48_014091, partial [Paspalum notatum var. saurae]
LYHLNETLLVLLPKKDNPALLRDYRPISLIHSFGKKIFSKVLANETLLVLLPKKGNPALLRDYRPISLIHSIGKIFSKVLANHLAPQLAFLDNFRYMQGAVRALHAKRVPSLLIKFDLAKAFDSISWIYFDTLASRFGSMIGLSCCSRRPAPRFALMDPLVAGSIMLLWNALVPCSIWQMKEGFFPSSVAGGSTIASLCMRMIATGLVTNVSKSQLFPIRCSEVETLRKDNSLVKGRLVLVQITLLVIPVFLMIALGLSPWAVELIDHLRISFFWIETDAVSRGKCYVAWIQVCRPKILGGLGLPNLQLVAWSLQMRWFWLALTDTSQTWASFSTRV